MSNINYWQRRKAMNMYHYMQSAEETSKEISKVYHKASLVLSNEMDKIFERFVTKHKLSEDDARKLLTSIKDKTSLEEIKAELRKGATGSDKRELLAELESPAYAYRLNRLEDKQQQIDNLMNTVYNQEKALSTDHYKELMGESYNRSMYEIQRQAGIGYSFDKLDSKTIDNMLKSKWSGANYSSRIWNNTQKLADSLKTELIIGLLTGEREADISKNLMFQFASGANNARRLVRTESCHIANEMDMKAYEESGIDTYVFVATLDLRTSAICASLDGKRFKVKDQQPGVNAPPMHPWCRSTTICDISDEELSQMKRRSKNPVTGKTELVPENMTYEEWHKKYVDGNKDAELKEKMIRNKAKDKRQFDKYIYELKNYIPDNLEDFQKIKYTDKYEYGVIKAQYKAMGYYNKALENEPKITSSVKKLAETSGMETKGLENRIKSKDSYLRKVRSNYKADGNEYEIKDILRYTLVSETENHVKKVKQAIDIYANQGYNTIKVKNYWIDENNPYNGINTIVQASNGQRFELQYHTNESFEIKNGKMHELYEKQRLIEDTNNIKYIELQDKMFELSESMKMPKNIEVISNEK